MGVVTRHQYKKALEVVNLYVKQLEDELYPTTEITIEFIIREKQISRRLKNVLTFFRDKTNYVYAHEITKHTFLSCRNVGIGSWHEFEKFLLPE